MFIIINKKGFLVKISVIIIIEIEIIIFKEFIIWIISSSKIK